MPKSSTGPTRAAASTRRRVERLERFSAGGQSVVAFCAAEGVSQSNFYLWRRRPTQPVAPPANDAPAVVPLRVTPSPATPIELAMPSGTGVRFPADARPELLIAVLRGLEERPC